MTFGDCLGRYVRLYSTNNRICKIYIKMIYLPHPPCSPDLNLIENWWKALKHDIAKIWPRPKTKTEIWELAQRLWNGYDKKKD